MGLPMYFVQSGGHGKEAAKLLLQSMEKRNHAVVIAGQEILEREAKMSERMQKEAVKLPL